MNIINKHNKSSDYAVLLPIHMGTKLKFLEESICSVKKQTIRPNEFFLLVDGKITDDCEFFLKNLKKSNSKIKVLRSKENLGLAMTLNFALSKAKSSLIFRLDSDDIAHPQRAELQLNFLNKNPSIDLVSTFAWDINDVSSIIGTRASPTDNFNIATISRFRNPILHPTVMFRKNSVLRLGGYPNFKYSQDYALWGLMLKSGCKFSCIAKPLTFIRVDNNFYNRRGLKYFLSEYSTLRYLRSIGFLSFGYFIFQVIFRFISRILPVQLTKKIYLLLRITDQHFFK